LRWEFKYGSQRDWLEKREASARQEQVRRQAGNILSACPVLTDSQDLIWYVFQLLHSSRAYSVGMGGAIPQGIDPTKVADLAWLTYENPADLLYMIMNLDAYWQSLEAGKRQDTGGKEDLDKKLKDTGDG